MTWQNKLIKKKCFDSPVVEVTPVIWKGKLLLVETWQTHWEDAPMTQRQYYVRIRDEQTDEIIHHFMHDFGFASAFVWEDTMYVFAGKVAGGSDSEKFDT